MEITAFTPAHLSAAAELFTADFRQLHAATPALPDRMADPQVVEMLLEDLFDPRPGLAALEDRQLVGFMGWYVVDDFRAPGRRAAYCPEWAHAVAPGRQATIYPALYRAAARQWLPAGCNTHAITLLAHDPATIDAWFWSGFGLTVVDAVRPMQPLEPSPAATGFTIRQASLEDAPLLAELEAEHWQHYLEPPVLMAAIAPSDEEEVRDLLSEPENSFWLAEAGGQALGYLRFEGRGFGAAAIVEADTTVANTGAYVRPDQHGRGVAPALLDAALRHYTARGYTCSSVDFKSFNPEAVRFWLRYYQPVAYSVIRVPERDPKRKSH